MIFNSFEFIWLFPLIFITYYSAVNWQWLIARFPKVGNLLLLVISYGLYLKWKPIYAILLFGVTAITYLFALKIERDKAYGNKLYIVWCGIALASLPLLVFKYYDFINDTLTNILKCANITVGLPGLNMVMPLGISFFTLQAIGYLVDVYLRRIKTEHNWWSYMLFVSFFPQIASGPISKGSDLLPQINAERKFKYTQAVSGLKWLLWGIFMKVVLGDRLGGYIDSFDGQWRLLSGGMNMALCLLYSIQIYGDFAGYSFMAVGVGKLLGFELVNNFKRPYLSQSVTEFWHRWHISLSIWLKDYIYIPLGGNRCSKLRNCFNIIITFLVSGLWHGANWNFILWGGLHGLFQVFEKLFGLNKLNSSGFIRVARVVMTFMVVSFAWIFFRQQNLHDAFTQIERIFTDFHYNLNFSSENLFYIIIGLIIMIYLDLVEEFEISSFKFYQSKFILIRWCSYVLLTMIILLLGVFDASQFIYVNF